MQSPLALLTPGVTTGASGEQGQDTAGRYGDIGAAVLSVNGTRPQANNFILDGVDNNDSLQNVILFFPPVDATQEFKVDTSVAPAQYGRAGGALVISSIKSGTNHLHGSAFEFYRSNKFAANPNYEFPYNLSPAGPKSAYNQNQFGGSAGLPILRDRLFLFGDYQGTRIQAPSGSGYDTVPTAKMRTGDFSELLNKQLASNGLVGPNGTPIFTTYFPRCYPNSAALDQNGFPATSLGQIYDPLTCQPFQGNIIPTNRLNPASVNYLNAFPLPTLNDRLIGNYFYQQTRLAKYNTFDTRLDWNASQSDLLFLRFSYDNTSATINSQLAPNGNRPLLNANGQQNFLHGRGYDLGYTHTFSPRIINEARIAYSRDNYGYLPPNFGESVGAELGINDTTLGAAVNTGGPLTGGFGTELTYTGDFGPFEVPQNVYEVTDTLGLSLHSHQLSVGGTVIRRVVNYYRPIEGKGGLFYKPAAFHRVR